MTPEGAFLISKDRHILFLHKSELRDDIKMGSEINGRIVFIRKDGHVNISLRPPEKAHGKWGRIVYHRFFGSTGN